MARTRVIIGYTGREPRVVYVGDSGSGADAAMSADTDSERFEIFEGPGRRKHNSKFTPAAKAEAEAAASKAKSKSSK